MPAVPASHRRADDVRALARRGVLAVTVAAAAPPERARLTGGAYDIAWPVVFSGLTQGLERRRGHLRCATSVRHLSDDCLDRFEDDVEAVVHDVVHFARKPIENLESWIASRLGPATVDGHRRRRGALGALQRPRPPKWLVTALGADPWLVLLAVRILVWVGVPASAGGQLWPIESWAALRYEHTGEHDGAGIRGDIERVLAAMRARPRWYADYVERPLGRKQAPLLPAYPGPEPSPERASLPLVDEAERQDARMRALAYEAVLAVQRRIAGGEPAEAVVGDVIGLVFGDGDPGAGRPDGVLRTLRDEAGRRRIVEAVLAVVREDAADRA